MMKNCLVCEQEFNTEISMDDFCSNECIEKYWADPKKVQITTDCPSCKRQFTREIFSVELRSFQSLTMCDICSGEETIIIGTKKYE